ncbi:hypothetical protein [Brevibacillus sp. HB2.2]|uniref:hypothetical protein n=1 Tax=Brevibacillus sp. HB2.2 TaxID=2738846 RepID=UPI00156AF645|nr:hypothetical protein [Brevibacillus sp. HB2.2]NRS52074.1 hypothetical protein [Brevibacillus sp. HB2.2]
MNAADEIAHTLIVRLAEKGFDMSDVGLRNSIIMDLNRTYGEGLEQGVIEGSNQALQSIENKIEKMKAELL